MSLDASTTPSGPSGIDAGPMRLHHVGIVVADARRAAERYVGLYGYEFASGPIHDPVQTAIVQFVRLPSDATLLEFVAPDGPESKLKNALTKGGGIHHLCYVTDDIERTCERLTREKLILIQAPVPAVAFPGRRIAWLMGRDRVLVELVGNGDDSSLGSSEIQLSRA